MHLFNDILELSGRISRKSHTTLLVHVYRKYSKKWSLNFVTTNEKNLTKNIYPNRVAEPKPRSSTRYMQFYFCNH